MRIVNQMQIFLILFSYQTKFAYEWKKYYSLIKIIRGLVME